MPDSIAPRTAPKPAPRPQRKPHPKRDNPTGDQWLKDAEDRRSAEEAARPKAKPAAPAPAPGKPATSDRRY